MLPIPHLHHSADAPRDEDALQRLSACQGADNYNNVINYGLHQVRIRWNRLTDKHHISAKLQEQSAYHTQGNGRVWLPWQVQTVSALGEDSGYLGDVGHVVLLRAMSSTDHASSVLGNCPWSSNGAHTHFG